MAAPASPEAGVSGLQKQASATGYTTRYARKRLGGAPTERRTMALKALALA